MNDDKMDELLRLGTRDYNEPGAVPREALWARIEAERHGRAPSVVHVPSRTRRGWVWGAVAAAALLTTGIVIGRRLERATGSATTNVAVKPPASTRPESAVAKATPHDTAPRTNDPIVVAIRGETQRTDASVRRLAQAPGDAQSAQNNLAYRLVVLRHLAGSEAMITAFRSSARNGEVDAQIGDWSRELLTTTRMLEASPVTRDPTMKRLLEDLDLVIVQIAQYVSTGKHDPNDLDLIEQSINKRGVMTKLRSTIPARALPAGT
jgi:hypothetical protein